MWAWVGGTPANYANMNTNVNVNMNMHTSVNVNMNWASGKEENGNGTGNGSVSGSFTSPAVPAADAVHKNTHTYAYIQPVQRRYRY